MIRFILALIFFAAATAPAETLQEAVASRRPRLQDPAEILAELTAPALVATTNLVVTTKPVADVAWESAAAVAITNLVSTLTGNPTNAVARVGALRPDQMAALVRARLRSDSAREVHDAITRTQMIRTPRKVTLPKDAATVTWEQIAVGEIESFIEAVTGSRDKALERIAALNSLQMLAAVRNGKKAKPDKAEDINARTDALVLLYLDAQRKGYDWPLPEHFGKPEKVVDSWIDSAGPSLVETECPGTPIPTVEETAALME